MCRLAVRRELASPPCIFSAEIPVQLQRYVYFLLE